MSRRHACMQHTACLRPALQRQCSKLNPEPYTLQISSQKRRTGVVSPKRFIQRLKRDREQFRSYDEHQVGSAGSTFPIPEPTARTRCMCEHAGFLHTRKWQCAVLEHVINVICFSLYCKPKPYRMRTSCCWTSSTASATCWRPRRRRGWTMAAAAAGADSGLRVQQQQFGSGRCLSSLRPHRCTSPGQLNGSKPGRPSVPTIDMQMPDFPWASSPAKHFPSRPRLSNVYVMCHFLLPDEAAAHRQRRPGTPAGRRLVRRQEAAAAAASRPSAPGCTTCSRCACSFDTELPTILSPLQPFVSTRASRLATHALESCWRFLTHPSPSLSHMLDASCGAPEAALSACNSTASTRPAMQQFADGPAGRASCACMHGNRVQHWQH
jgi:hypothetical protein